MSKLKTLRLPISRSAHCCVSKSGLNVVVIVLDQAGQHWQEAEQGGFNAELFSGQGVSAQAHSGEQPAQGHLVVYDADLCHCCSLCDSGLCHTQPLQEQQEGQD